MRLILVVTLIIGASSCIAQDYSSFTQTIQTLNNKNGDELDKAWNELTDTNQLPLVYEDSVAFFYRGTAKSVVWIGDFNGWGYDKNINVQGKQISGSDIWILKSSFEKDARLDYKILVDGNNWVLDPLNPHSQWSGIGGGSPNSELRMPLWKEDPITTTLVSGAKQGKIEKDILFNSNALGYQLTYSLYIPIGYNPEILYPVIYVTDGYEYMHDRMGNMITILDNLIYLGKIKPVIAVFIDNREPINRSNNKRMAELAMNEKYLNFLTEELIPKVEKKYHTSQKPGERAILGTSMGGLSAAYFAFTKPEIFGLAGIQSPAFYVKPSIYTICDNPENPTIKTFMTTGRIYDAEDGALKMKAILDKNTCAYQYKEVNQGHSWGNWRDLIDDILIYFFPPN